MQLCHVKIKINAYLLAQGCKSDWTVLSADKAERKMGISFYWVIRSHFGATKIFENGMTVFVLRI